MIAPLTAACILGAATAYNLSPLSLQLILHVEGGRVGACTTQVNGMHDCGPAQVNAEIWVPKFASLLNRPIREVFFGLRDNGCFNIYAAAYILRAKTMEGGNIWEGMGRYNSSTPSIKHGYQQKLIAAYQNLLAPRPVIAKPKPAAPHKATTPAVAKKLPKRRTASRLEKADSSR